MLFRFRRLASVVMNGDKRHKRIVRLLGLLDKLGSARVEPTAGADMVVLRFGDGRTAACRSEMISQMVRNGWLASVGKGNVPRLSVTDDGRTWLARLNAGGGFAGQHRQIDRCPSTGQASLNHAESPLTRLARPRGGVAFIDRTQLAAGERLRSDFEHAHLRQRVTASWDPTHVARRGGAGNDGLEPGDRALDARARFHAALDAVGPEFAGILVDACCFLKGLEQVESERGWPRRSAKVLLGAALRALDRHYNPPPEPRRARQRHWGTPDYRPDLPV